VRVLVRVDPEGRGLDLPRYQSEHAAGMDLLAAIEQELQLAPGERALVSTGVALAIPVGYEGQVRPRSGLAIREGVTLLNAPGTIDADYRGTLKLVVINHGSEPVTIRRGERLAQLVLARVERAALERVDELPGTPRGEGGFGSTGR
jgi:dUTP pyrophosphatase